MKKLTQNGNLLKAFALTAMLAGCQNEELVTQQTPTDITTGDNNAKTIFTPQLLKEGANDLEYYGEYDANRGKLKKLTNTGEGAYTEYQYNGQTIVAQRKKISTNALVYQVTYQLDGLGRCVESLSTETNKSLKYEYGQLSRLTKIYNKNSPNERIEFTYEQSATTSLKSINLFNQANSATKEINFSYMVQGGNAMENKYQTNPDALGVTSKYLPVFGIFHSNLPTYETTKEFSPNGGSMYGYSFTYAFNATGYAKTITATSSMTNLTIATNRTYTTPKL
jgi:hypothetical protein